MSNLCDHKLGNKVINKLPDEKLASQKLFTSSVYYIDVFLVVDIWELLIGHYFFSITEITPLALVSAFCLVFDCSVAPCIVFDLNRSLLFCVDQMSTNHVVLHDGV